MVTKLEKAQHEAVLRNGAKQDFSKYDKDATMSHLHKQLLLAIERLEKAMKANDEKQIAKNMEIVKSLKHTLGIKEK